MPGKQEAPLTVQIVDEMIDYVNASPPSEFKQIFARLIQGGVDVSDIKKAFPTRKTDRKIDDIFD